MEACFNNADAEAVDVVEGEKGRFCRRKRSRLSLPSRFNKLLKSNLCTEVSNSHGEHQYGCNNNGSAENREKASRSATLSAPCDGTNNTVDFYADNIAQEADDSRAVICHTDTWNGNNTNQANGTEVVTNAEEGKRVPRKRYKPKKFDDYDIGADLPERAKAVRIVSSGGRSHGKQPIHNCSQNPNLIPPKGPIENLRGGSNARLPQQIISKKPIKSTSECDKDTLQDNGGRSRVENRSHCQLLIAKRRWKDLATRLLIGLDDQQHKGSRQTLKNGRLVALRGARTIEAKKYLPRSSTQQGLHTRQFSLLKRMNLWMTRAKFTKRKNLELKTEMSFQRTIESEGISAGAQNVEFLIGEDERAAFAQNLVKYCQKNAKMRSLFLDSVKMLAKNGILQSVAYKLLQNQNSCEEAQGVVRAWENYQVQDPAARKLPIDLFKAVVELDDKVAPSSSSIAAPEDLTNIFSFSHIQNRVWQVRLPDDGSFAE